MLEEVEFTALQNLVPVGTQLANLEPALQPLHALLLGEPVHGETTLNRIPHSGGSIEQ